nr:MAG TPA: hypothetical protein [Caudoviricetes sp.]
MITTDEVLRLLDENNYEYVARDIDGYLYAYKAIPEFEDGYFSGESSLDIDSVDDKFFLYAVKQEKMKELGVLFEEYGEYCDYCDKTKEDKDTEFVKFAKEEMNHVIELFGRKSGAYGSSDDVFHNFRQTAKRIYGKDTFDNMFLVAETYKDKHNVALAKGIAVPEVDERLRDNIVYSLLQLAMIAENWKLLEKAARGESDD